MDKIIEIELTDPDTGITQEFVFTVNPDRYAKFQNALSGKDKAGPLHNFCVACCDPEQRTALAAYLRENDGMAGMMASELVDQYLPKVEMTVKKRSPGATASAAAR